MRRQWQAGLGAALSLLLAAHAQADEVQWRSATVQPAAETIAAPLVTLGRPQPQTAACSDPRSPGAFRLVARAQSQDVAAGQLPPPPPPPPPPSATLPGAREEGYNCGVATENPTSTHPILDGGWNFIRGVPGAVTGVFQSQGTRRPFQSDNAFPMMISPVSNPFFFEDPRALTELRPVFIYEGTSPRTPIFAGGSVEYFGLQGRVAITDRLSLVLSKFGWDWINIHDPVPPAFQSNNGFSDVQLGPQFTLIRNDCTGTLLALGLNFDIPTGSRKVFQDTGGLSLAPYLSFGQNFWKTSFGSFNFLNTTGYDFSTTNQRSEFFYTSFHLDYDVANLHKIYPLMELNWFYYTTGGHAEPPVGFEGRDLINFGTAGVSGHSDLSLAFGLRYKFTECVQLGAAFEFPLDGRRDLNDFRVTVDMIFRY